MVIVSVAAIAYMLITQKQICDDERKGKQQSCCGTCKHFEKIEGSSFFGKCLYFFKPFRAWENACHRYEEKD